MALQNIQKVDSVPLHQVTKPGAMGSSYKQNFGLRYDPETGDYIVQNYVVENVNGQRTIAWGTTTLYKNGEWYATALQDGYIFSTGVPKTELPNGTALADKIKEQTKAAHAAAGGNAGGHVLNPTVLQRGTPSKTADGQAPTITLPSAVASGLTTSFVSRNENELFGKESRNKGLLFYPSTILKDRQDYLQITQFNYKAPYADSLFPRSGSGRATADVGSILTSGLKRGTAKKDKIGFCILPIPEGINDTNKVSWGPEGMNNMTAAVMAMMMSNPNLTAAGLGGANLTEALTGANVMPLATMIELLTKAAGATGGNSELIKTQVKATIGSMAAQKAGFDVSPETILSRGYGVIPNQNMELLFNNVALRAFNFGFKLSPRSRSEAATVRRIIRFFKQGMAARISSAGEDPGDGVPGVAAGSTSLFLGSPNVFELKYMHGPTNEPIKGLNRFKTCALTDMSMQYTNGGMYQSFTDGQPAHMTMALSFTELEPVYENDYQANISSSRLDQQMVYNDEIGY